jgi:hypothetical protein
MNWRGIKLYLGPERRQKVAGQDCVLFSGILKCSWYFLPSAAMSRKMSTFLSSNSRNFVL